MLSDCATHCDTASVLMFHESLSHKWRKGFWRPAIGKTLSARGDFDGLINVRWL